MYGFYLDVTSSFDTFVKNNWFPSPSNPDYAVYNNNCDTYFDFSYNYWSSNDSSAIANKMKGTYSSKIIWQPFRRSVIDTASGADTIAPKAPDTTAAVMSSTTSCTVSWSASNTNEEIGGALSDLAGYRIYRATNANPSSWGDSIAQVSASSLQYLDTGLAPYTSYYYKIAAFDSHQNGAALFYNESWYSDSTASCSYSLPAYSGPKWYVSANSGSDTGAGNGSETYPYKTITKALTAVYASAEVAGETIYVYAGTYTETVVIDSDYVSIIGADSSLTIIDPPGDSSIAGLYGVYAKNKNNLYISKLKVTNCDYGIYFDNVDTSTINDVAAELCSGGGFVIENNSDFNTIQNCYAYNNSAGFLIVSYYCIITNNTASNNSDFGFGFVSGASAYHTITNNISSNNAGYGFGIAEVGDTVTNNIVSNNSNAGFCIWGNGNFTNNISSNNMGAGFEIHGDAGIYKNNTISNNKGANGYGFYLDASTSNYFSQNTVDSNEMYGVYIQADVTSCTFVKNNIKPSPINPDSCVLNEAANSFDFKYNYWSTTDSSAIANKIKGDYASKILWQPYSLSEFDTAAGADTIAPDSITVISADTSTGGQIRISWDTPAYSGALGGAGLAGYNIFRAKASELSNGDTNNWYAYKLSVIGYQLSAFVDTTVIAGETYYYRVTAFDSHYTNGILFNNEAWYSSAISAIAPAAAARSCTNIYVDTALGDNANSGFAAGAGNAKKTINGALAIAQAGDTIMIAAGTYCETVVIQVNNLALIGADSATTIIAPPGDSSVAGLYGIYASDKNNLTIKNLKVTDCLNGIYFVNVDTSIIDNVYIYKTGASSGCGIYLFNGCESNTIQNCLISENYSGLYLEWHNNSNCIMNNYISNNSFQGLTLYDLCNSNIVTGNNVLNNNNYGLRIYNSTNNVIKNNTSSYNLFSGYYFDVSCSNTLTGNIASNNSEAGFKLLCVSNNILTNNVSSNNKGASGYGFCIISSLNNNFSLNTADSNQMYGFYLDVTSSFDTFVKNNWFPSPSNPDYAVYNNCDTYFDFSYNYWSTNYSDALANKIKGTYSSKINWQPFRRSVIDTASGADTIAPKAPDTAAAVMASTTSCTVSWSASNTNEEIGGALTDLAGYRIYRETNANPSSWGDSIAQVSASSLQYLDTGLAPYTSYYYKIAAFDSHQNGAALFYNESWYSDSTASCSYSLPAYSGPKWYVSANSGSDTGAGNGSETYPYKTITKALSMSAAGDSVYISAGTYSETVVIDTNNISLIGTDSSTTIIDPPGDSSVFGLYGIYASTKTNLTIKNLRVTDAYCGIYFNNIDTSIIENVKVDLCGGAAGIGAGISVSNGSCSNIVTNCFVNKNNGYGIRISGAQNRIINNVSSYNSNEGIDIAGGLSNNYNFISGNIVYSNNQNGVRVDFVSYNTLINNKIFGNSQNGIYLLETPNNIISNNSINSNNCGIYLEGSEQNTDYNFIYQNDILLNTGYQINFAAVCYNDTLYKNNIQTSNSNPDSAVFNNVNTIFKLNFNYWFTTDSSAIANKIKGDYASKILWQPFKITAVDIGLGADTIAPKSPDTAAVVSFGDTNCIISWSASNTNEEIGGGLTDLGGYRIYRANSPNPADWGNYIASVAAGVLEYQNTNIPLGDTYYYRVTAFDNKAQYANESWYSDSTPNFTAGAMPAYNGPNWYVSGDTGSDGTNGNGSETYPFKTIGKALQTVYSSATTSGETVYVYKGTYAETVVIDSDNVSLIGADSATTIIDPVGTSSTGGLYGIYATNRTNLRLSNFHITDCYYGIYFNNVDSSVIDNVTIDSCLGYNRIGIYIYNGSCSNIVQNCYLNKNYYGIILNVSSCYNTVNNNKIISNNYGCFIQSSSSYNIFNNNTVDSNQRGFWLNTLISYCVFNNNSASYNTQNGFILQYTATYNTFNNNTAASNQYGFTIAAATSSNNTFSGNTSCSNTENGFQIMSSGNVLTGNSAYSNSQRGFYITGANNALTGNTAYSNTQQGFYITGSNNTLTGNSACSNSDYGIYLTSSNNILTGNRFYSNQNYGLYRNGGSGNIFNQNEFKLNNSYQIAIIGSSANDTYQTNNIQPCAAEPDSAVYNASTSNFNFQNNYWFTTDSAVINNRIAGDGKSYILWQPYSLSEFDASSGADTIAPDSVTVIGADTSVGGQITINWTTPNYTGTASGDGLAGYNIFRAKANELTNGDTNNWYAYKLSVIGYQLSAFVDTTVSVGETYYYRVTAFDSHYTNGVLFNNESWYSPIMQAIPLSNRPPQLILAVTVLTAFEDTPAFIIAFDSNHISDSDVNDTISNMTLYAEDTSLVQITVLRTDTMQYAIFTVLTDTFGVDTITFYLKDATNASDSEQFVLTILNVNDTPVITSAPGDNAAQGVMYYYQVTATDTDVDAISYRLLGAGYPEGMTISDTGSIYWTPPSEQVGANTVTVLVGDGMDTARQSFTITVLNVNDSPVLRLPILDMSVFEDTPAFEYIINSDNVSDSDAADTIGTMTVSVIDTNLVKAVVVKNGDDHIITFTVLPDIFGVDTITIKIADSSGAFDVRQFVLTILPVNDTPYFISQMSNIISSRVKYTFIQTAGDIDDTHLTITADSPLPLNCEIITESDTGVRIIWLPAEEGVETISLRVTDASGADSLVNYVVNIIDGPRKVTNIRVSYNSDSGVKLSWDAPLFNNVSVYTVNVTDSEGNIVWAHNYDSSVKTCNIPASNFELCKDYKLSVNVTDANGNVSSETPSAIMITYKPNYQAIAEFRNDLNGKKIFIDNTSADNNLLIPVTLPANKSDIDYVYIEYKTENSQNWQTADLKNYSNDRIAVQNIKDNLAAGLWDLNADNINAGLYDLRVVTIYKNGIADTSSSIMLEFTNSKTDAEVIQKFDDAANTTFFQIKTAVGAETIVQIIPDIKTINGIEIQKNVVVTAPYDVISSDSRQQIYNANGFDTLIIEKITIAEAGDSETSDSKLVSMNQWDLEAAIVRVRLLRYNYSETMPFDKLVSIEIPYFDEDNDGRLDNSVFVGEQTLKAFYKQDASDTLWKEVPDSDGWSVIFDYTNNKATLKVKHFTIYALFGIKQVPPSANLNNVVVFPNPFRPNDGRDETGKEFFGVADIDNRTGIHIINLPSNCSIEIYDIRGRKISTLSNIAGGYGMAIWDAKTDEGEKVGSGTYFIVIKGTGQTVVKKVAVIR